MKQLSKLCAIAMLVAFASCENNEPIEETLDQEVQHLQLRVIDGNVVGDGEEDLELQFNENSEILVKPSQTTFGKSSITEGLVGSDLTDFLASMLPNQVTVTTTSKPGNDAYFNLSIDDNSGYLSGTGLPAWCTDQDLSLENNETLTFDVYSTYGGLPDDKFEMPENFDKVNWLINQTIIGEESPNGLGTYTFGHFQYAIWLLIDDSVCELCTFLTDPTGTWNADGNDVAQAQEIRDLALAQGNGFVPTVGELMAIVLIPEGKQSVIIGKEVQAIPCEDCVGDVTDLTLQWNWHNDYRVRVYQRYENTWYATKIFDQVVGLNDQISLKGANHDGSIGKWAYVYVGNCYYTKFRTDCNLNIGPGYKRGVLEVTEGVSSDGGELCEYEPSNNYCWWW